MQVRNGIASMPHRRDTHKRVAQMESERLCDIYLLIASQARIWRQDRRAGGHRRGTRLRDVTQRRTNLPRADLRASLPRSSPLCLARDLGQGQGTGRDTQSRLRQATERGTPSFLP